MQENIRPATIDALIEKDGKILLVLRKFEPYIGFWALPGGFVDPTETTEQAVIREVKEETGLNVKVKSLFGVYSDPNRDSQRHTVTSVYLAERTGGKLIASNETKPEWFDLDDLPDIAFDHGKIISDFKKKKKE